METLLYIEILGSPLAISQPLALPQTDMSLSWWLSKQSQPELELQNQFQILASCTTITNGHLAAKLLLSSTQTDDNRPLPCTPISMLGTVSAVCISDNHSAESNGFQFIIDLSVEAVSPTGMSDDWGNVQIPILFSGSRFLGLYASLFIGDSLFVTCIQPANMVNKDSASIAVFCTTAESHAFRVDEFEGIDGSQLFARQASHSSAFTHGSQQSLLSQIELGRESIFSVSPLDPNGKGGSTPATQPVDKNILVRQEKLESYEGVISRMLDMALGIYVIDSTHILVLRYWPQFHPLLVLRPGTRVLLDNMHVVLLANSEDYHWSWLSHAFPESMDCAEMLDRQRALVFGACARSWVRITGFSSDLDPGTARLMANCELTRIMTRKAEGLVPMIEAMEAFWKFSQKFPNGPVSAKHSAESEARLMSLAMMWAGVARSGQRHKHVEFLRHGHCCQSGRAKAATRVLTLENVLQRLRKYLGSRKQSAFPVDNATAGAASTEVAVDGVSPTDLQLQTVPLIGRLVVNERGELFLWDSTGHLLVHPSFFSASKDSAKEKDAKSALFAGQMLVGHLYAWNNWRFVIETIDVMSVSKASDRVRAMSAEPSPDFRLVYAATSNPVVLYVDRTFGGLGGSSRARESQNTGENNISGDSGMEEEPLCFVLFVHWQGMAAPAPAVNQGAMKTAEQTTSSESSEWKTRIAVRGAALKIDYSSFDQQLQNAMDDQPHISISLPGNGASGMGQPESCFLHFTPNKVPAKFAPNCAYVVCLHKKSRSGYLSEQGAAQSIFFVKLGLLDRVYPVHLLINGQRLDTSLPQMVMQLPIATVNMLDQRLDEDQIKQLHAPQLSSVKKLHDALVSDAAAGSAIAGRLVSVHGIVTRRKVNSVVEFACNRSDNSQANASSLVAGMFENVVFLGDESDISLTIPLYIKLYTFSHPLGLLPGACIEFQNVAVGISKTTNQLYLTSTNLTTLQHMAAQSMESAIISAEPPARVDPERKPSKVCIGELYRQVEEGHTRNGFVFNCRVEAVEHLGISVECKVCSQTISNMSCLCIRKRYRMVDSSSPNTGYSSDSTTVQAHVELLCRVADGSGMARVVVNNAANLVHVFGLLHSGLEELYEAAAKSWNGQLCWNQSSASEYAAYQHLKHLKASNAQESGSAMDSVLGRIVSQAGSASIVVQGAVVESPNEQQSSLGTEQQQQQQQQQVLRIDGQSVVLTKHAVPRIMAGGKIFQPVAKIRLTNVSIVRLRKGGKRFELACYKNKVTEWRTGVEKDIDEVLQIHQVYMNVSKGQVAKTEELRKCFGTENLNEVINEILMKGEQQVSDKERTHNLDNMLRDIATVVAEKCVNPSTQQPYTVTMIEKAMADIHYSVNTNRSAKQQALDVIKQIQDQKTLPISRAQMRIRVTMPGKDAKRLKDKLSALISSTEDEEKGEEYELICLIDPGQYRAITELVGREVKGAGEVVILSLRDTNDEDNTL
ncbi:hypothetical protein IWW45_004464 [Coemansia sp. RSA 485]|nr:hypothetical protein IWW45_004464 [Coemansia sp. RSA 485]